MTLQLDKFHHLEREYEGSCEVICVPCVGLASRIERGQLDAEDLHALLVSLIGAYAGQVDGVVLGCTHYPFVRDQIRAIVGEVPLLMARWEPRDRRGVFLRKLSCVPQGR
jgi:glutamate racemase